MTEKLRFSTWWTRANSRLHACNGASLDSAATPVLDVLLHRIHGQQRLLRTITVGTNLATSQDLPLFAQRKSSNCCVNKMFLLYLKSPYFLVCVGLHFLNFRNWSNNFPSTRSAVQKFAPVHVSFFSKFNELFNLFNFFITSAVHLSSLCVSADRLTCLRTAIV